MSAKFAITFEIHRTSRIQFAVGLPTQDSLKLTSYLAIEVHDVRLMLGIKFWSLSVLLNRSPPRIPQMVHVAVVTSSRRES